VTKLSYPCGSMSVISIAGGSYIRPIADLVFQLTRCKRDPSYQDHPLNSEVDYSTVLILLLVLMAESYLARVRHFDKTTDAKTKKWAPTYLASLDGCKRLANRFSEVYLLRNAIVHNHVFEYENVWNSNGDHRDRKFKIDTSWQGERGATAYSKHVDIKKYAEPKTKLLGLRVTPTRMGCEDALKVFETIYQVLKQLHKKKYLDISIDNLHVRYQPIGQNKKTLSFPFWKLIEEIRQGIIK
jgi:hypothetical protein